MSKDVDYRGYTISSTPVHLSGTNEWKPEIVISAEHERVVTAGSVFSSMWPSEWVEAHSSSTNETNLTK